MSQHECEDDDWIYRPAFWRAAQACHELYAAPASERADKRLQALSLMDEARGGADFEEIEVAIVYETFGSNGALSERDMRHVYSRMNALLKGESTSISLAPSLLN
jgi:hypothetical protein